VTHDGKAIHCRLDHNAHRQSTMTISVPGMRSNKLVSMDIDQLRGWASFMDKAMIASLIATLLAVTALGITTWLSFRYSAAVRAHEHALVDRYKGMEGHSAQLEQDVAAARERAMALAQEVSTARGRTAALEQEVSVARERAAALERDAATARERAGAFEQAARDATEQAARAANQLAAKERTANERAANEGAARESEAAGEKARTPPLDAAEIEQRLADVGKLVREATARPVETPPPSPIVASLRKYAGTKAAVFVLDPVADASAAGSTITASLGDAGWAPQTWKWTGVAGIVGVVVLFKDGSDPATVEAASSLVEALRSAGFNATKGDWPADWRRFRGALDGPQTPGPTEAPIRIVIGAKPR
jgi:hypothetical protein